MIGIHIERGYETLTGDNVFYYHISIGTRMHPFWDYLWKGFLYGKTLPKLIRLLMNEFGRDCRCHMYIYQTFYFPHIRKSIFSQHRWIHVFPWHSNFPMPKNFNVCNQLSFDNILGIQIMSLGDGCDDEA